MTSQMSKDDVQVLDKSCYLIRSALDIAEQLNLFEEIQGNDQPSNGQQPSNQALYPSPRTVRFGDNRQTKIKYDRSALVANPTVYSQLVDQANEAILQATKVDLSDYKSITLSAIEYEAATHTLTEHIDHDDSFVYLLSIGCATNFVVQGPNMTDKTTIQLKSGDLMVFDASTTGNILHVISGVRESSCPAELASKFSILQNHRYGIQLRVRF